jgi:hypothetical protein
LILDVILQANFEISNQRMATNKLPLNSNYNKIQQSHAKFYYLIKFGVF